MFKLKDVGFMVSLRLKKKVFPHHKSMEANEPQGVVNLDPRGMVYMIYKGDRQTLLYTIIYTVALMFIDNKMFFCYMSMRAIDPQEHDQFAPKGLNWQDFCWGSLDNATN